MVATWVLVVWALSARAETADWLARGSALFQSGKLSQAAVAFEDAAKASTAAASGFLDAAVVYRDLGQDLKAVEMFERAVAFSSTDAQAQAELGWAALRVGRYVEANRAFDAALAIKPGLPDALLGRGRLFLEAKRPDDAARTFEGLVKADPDHTLGWLYLARSYEAAGRSQDAVDAYQKSFATDSAFSEVRLALGSLYRSLKRFNDAWREYATILTIDPRNLLAQRLKKELAKQVRGRPPRSVVPTETLSQPVELRFAEPADGMPFVRVAIGTSVSGRPELTKALTFRCTGPFRVVEPYTGKLLKIGQGRRKYTIRPVKGGGMFEVVDEKQQRLLRFGRSVGFEPVAAHIDSLIFQELRIANGTWWSSYKDRQLKGRVEVHVRGRRLYLVDRLPLEDYVYGVVTEEMPRRFPMEALKAQAVIARTMTLYEERHLKPHRKYGYDLCDGQHCQVYGGVAGESSEARQAVDETRGQVLTYKNDVAQTPYSSNCGGRTQDSGEVHGWAALPYLVGRLDGDGDDGASMSPWQLDLWLKSRPMNLYCDLVPGMPAARFRWIRSVPVSELESRVREERDVGHILRLVVVRRSRSGHANEIYIDGTKGRLRLDREELIRRTLGLGALRSTLLIVETERDRKGKPLEFVFYGAGWGHGVGLCQYGAAGRALKGQTYRQILDHYFPGTALKTLDY